LVENASLGSVMIYATALFTAAPLQGALPAVIRDNIGSFVTHHPELRHVHFDEPSARSYLSAQFDDTVLSAFDGLRPFAAKADLLRYCVIFKEGGLYSDVSWQCLGRLSSDPGKLTVFRDLMASSTWDAYTGVFMAPRNHPSLRTAIELCVRNIRERRYGVNPLCVTGPEVFGKAIALSCEPEDLILGEHVRAAETGHCLVQRQLPVPIVAVSKKSKPGTLEEFGIVGNNYNELWLSRRYFTHESLEWDFSSEQLLAHGYLHARQEKDGIVLDHREHGFVVWGPYVNLPSGAFEATFRLRCPPTTNVDVDIVAEGARRTLVPRHSVPASHPRIRFELSRFGRLVEARIYAGPGSENIAFEGLKIRALEPDPEAVVPGSSRPA
jgi:hypothetical protein